MFCIAINDLSPVESQNIVTLDEQELYLVIGGCDEKRQIGNTTVIITDDAVVVVSPDGVTTTARPTG